MYSDETKVENMQAAQGAKMSESFVFPRRIGFGECDAARIYKTPRAIDIAVEALDAWFEAIVGVSWATLVKVHDLDLSFMCIACEYLRPVTAGQTVQVCVRVIKAEATAITFTATADIDDSQPCFRVTLVICFCSRTTSAPIPTPSEFSHAIEQYLLECTDEVRALNGGHHAVRKAEYKGQSDAVSLPVQLKCVEVPFVQQHRIVYGECGLSGKVYPPRVYDMALEAVGEWYERIIGITWLQQCINLQGQPFVDINCLYLRDLEPGKLLSIVVKVKHLGTASIVYSVIGYDDSGLPCFDAQLAACYIDETSGVYKPTPFPEDYRRRILEYQARCRVDD